MPRVIAALITGGALGVAGSLTQALTRNPLADPGLLGVNAGTAFALIISSGRQARAISLSFRFPARPSLRWQFSPLAAGSRGMPGRCT
ncbi:MAG: iron ABC transporter permease [Rhodobacteraceae bacterium]|nr:iron ABC transporter permease [Paracoccaceae bacterium]